MFKRICKPRKEIQKTLPGSSERRLRKCPRQFLQQINEDEYDVILVQPKPSQAITKPVRAPADLPRFVFQPMATSTPAPKRKIKPAEPSVNLIKNTNIPQMIDEPDFFTEENHRLGPRLTMSQFIGSLPKKDKREDENMFRFDEEEISDKSPNCRNDDFNDIEMIDIDDFINNSCFSGIDLNKRQYLWKLIYSTDSKDLHAPDLADCNSPPFPINDSTRCIIKDIFCPPKTHKKRSFQMPTPREFFKTMKKAKKHHVAQQLERKLRKAEVLKGVSLEKELRHFYEFLKLLFDDTGIEDFE